MSLVVIESTEKFKRDQNIHKIIKTCKYNLLFFAGISGICTTEKMRLRGVFYFAKWNMQMQGAISGRHFSRSGSLRKVLSDSCTLPDLSRPLLSLQGSVYHLNLQQRRALLVTPALSTEMIDVTFVTNDGTKHTTKGKIGDNLLDVVVNNSVDLDGFGACEGTLACSTCHLVFKKEDFDRITDKITDEELDMLDLAYGLSDTSRLGCQVTLTKALDGVEVIVPAGVNDQRS